MSWTSLLFVRRPLQPTSRGEARGRARDTTATRVALPNALARHVGAHLRACLALARHGGEPAGLLYVYNRPMLSSLIELSRR